MKPTALKVSLLALAVSSAVSAEAVNMPAKNTFLADSTYAVTHTSSAQQGSVSQAGPMDTTRRLDSDEIKYGFVGPGHMIGTVSAPYPDGERVIWSAGVSTVQKSDATTMASLAVYEKPDAESFDEAWSDHVRNKIENGVEAKRIFYATREMKRFADTGALYPLVDNENNFYLGKKNGDIEVYGDIVAGDRHSGIELKRVAQLPAPATGQVVGLNMSYDGWLIAVTDDGFAVAMSRDFSTSEVIRLEGAPEVSANKDDPLNGWVRNSHAIDKDGGVYIAARDTMHKVVWNGSKWSKDEKDGAWVTAYPNSLGTGSGATPSLMGFGDDDRFVVITDGEKLMNLTLFWRDQIPKDWQGIEGKDRRIAASQPANMGDNSLTSVQSEQSVAVYGYGAVIVNNQPPSLPWYVPAEFGPVLAGYLATEEAYRPLGVQKYEWDPKTRELNEAWVNVNVSSPNSVPVISGASNMLYTGGARDGEWTMEAIDWTTGKESFHWKLGDNRYNTLFAPVVIDPAGDLVYGGPWGRVKLDPKN